MKAIRKYVIYILLALIANFIVQYCWINFYAKPIEAVDVTAIKGEQPGLEAFIKSMRGTETETNPVLNISAKFITAPDAQSTGDQKVVIFLYNRTGYVNIASRTLSVVAGSTSVAAEAELTAKDITAADFVSTRNASVVLVHVPDEPVFDPDAGAYIYHCLLRLAGRDVPCELSVFDKTPPVITGVHDIQVSVNSPILYKDGVEVKDNYDKNVKLTVKSDADVTQIGAYTVTYSAKDESGNEAVATANVTVVSVEEEWVFEKTSAILAEIINDGMSQREQAKAIYGWIRSNLRYAATPLEEDAVLGTYWAYKHGTGDCYTYCAINEVLLSQAGIQVLRITREPSNPVIHVWNLVNVGDGWYHFDSCPTYLPYDGFMFTESRALEYAEMLEPYRDGYYNYIKEDYPPVVQ